MEWICYDIITIYHKVFMNIEVHTEKTNFLSKQTTI